MKRRLRPDKSLSTSCLSGWQVASLCPYNFTKNEIWWRLRFWNNPTVSNYPGHLVKKTGVRTMTVLYNHVNRESPFHRQTRSKLWPWQKALVPTVSFNAEFYGRRDTQSWGLCISLHRQPLLHGYTLQSDPALWSRLSIVLEQRNRTRVLYRNRDNSDKYCTWTLKP